MVTVEAGEILHLLRGSHLWTFARTQVAVWPPEVSGSHQCYCKGHTWRCLGEVLQKWAHQPLSMTFHDSKPIVTRKHQTNHQGLHSLKLSWNPKSGVDTFPFTKGACSSSTSSFSSSMSSFGGVEIASSCNAGRAKTPPSEQRQLQTENTITNLLSDIIKNH